MVVVLRALLISSFSGLFSSSSVSSRWGVLERGMFVGFFIFSVDRMRRMIWSIVAEVLQDGASLHMPSGVCDMVFRYSRDLGMRACRVVLEKLRLGVNVSCQRP